MTWHATEYWIQERLFKPSMSPCLVKLNKVTLIKARDAIRDLYPDLPGSVHLAPIGVARKVALISNKDTFFTRTLPMLNQRALNPSTCPIL